MVEDGEALGESGGRRVVHWCYHREQMEKEAGVLTLAGSSDVRRGEEEGLVAREVPARMKAMVMANVRWRSGEDEEAGCRVCSRQGGKEEAPLEDGLRGKNAVEMKAELAWVEGDGRMISASDGDDRR